MVRQIRRNEIVLAAANKSKMMMIMMFVLLESKSVSEAGPEEGVRVYRFRLR